MDPASAVGLIGSVMGIANVAYTSVRRLSTLKTKYRQADNSVSLLIGQLCTIQAALDQIANQPTVEHTAMSRADWTFGLSTSLDGVEWIVASLDKKLNELERQEDGRLSLKGKTLLLWRDGEIKNYLDMLDRHVIALVLLLQVTQCKTPNEQRTVMEEEDSVTILRLARESTGSLCALDDSHSKFGSMSVSSQNTANLSTRFDFDLDLLGTQTYHTAFKHNYRDLMRQRAARQAGQAGGVDERIIKEKGAATRVSQVGHVGKTMPSEAMAQETNIRQAMNGFSQIKPKISDGSLLHQLRHSSKPGFFKRVKLDNAPKSPEQENPPEIKALLLGPSESGKSTLLELCRLLQDGGPIRKEIIFSNAVLGMRTILEFMEAMAIPLDDPSYEDYVKIIFMQPPCMKVDSLPEEVGVALKILWTDGAVQKAYKHRMECLSPDPFLYYSIKTDRLAASGSLLNDWDMVPWCGKTIGIYETTFYNHFSGRECRWHLFDVGGTRSQRKKWIHCFEKADLVFFTVDSCCYGKRLFEDEAVNCMEEALEIWKDIVNSQWFIHTGFVLLFTKNHQIESTLAEESPSKYLPDFPISGSVEEYKRYIANRFLSVIQDTSRPVSVLFEDLVQDPCRAASIIWTFGEMALRQKTAALGATN